jgi:outer membrane receptor for ferrienterochelin and colicins
VRVTPYHRVVLTTQNTIFGLSISAARGLAKIGLLAAFLLTSVIARAEAQSCLVQGVVRDPAGLPLPGALITVKPGALSLTTNEKGEFCLTGLAPARYVVTATLEGFAASALTVDVLDGDRTVRTLDFTLAVGGFRDETVVTGTRTAQGLADVPVRTEVVGRQAIDAMGARSLADAVEFTTGIRVESNCQNCNFSQIRVLGLDGPYTQILFDGQPLVSSLASVYGVEQIPTRLVHRIEVVKGGGSALYGAGSVGGVVNVIPREPVKPGASFESKVDASQGVPSYQVNGALDMAAPGRRAFITTFGQFDRVKPLDTTGDGFTEIARRDLDALGGRASVYLLSGRARWTADVALFDESRRGGNLLRLRPDEADIAEAIDTHRVAASTSWYHGVSTRWDYRLVLSMADTGRDSYYGTRQDPNAYGESANRLWLIDTQVNHYLGRHVLTWGQQATRETLTDSQPAYARRIDERYRNLGVYVQDDWRMAPRVQLLLGSRFDRSSTLDRVVASPRAALRYSPNEALAVRVSAAHGYRPPQVFDEDLHLSSVAGEAIVIRRSPDLKEETSANYIAGAEWKPPLGRGQGLLEVNAFLTTLDDLFFNIENPEPLTQQFEYVKVNLGRARVYGAEINLGWGTLGADEGILVQGGIVLQRARLGEPEPDFGSRDFFRTPRAYGNLTMTYARRYTRYFAGVRFTGRMQVPHRAGYIPEDRLERSPRFLTIDASVAHTFRPAGLRPRLVVTVGGRNLTNAYQKDFDQGIERDSDYIYGPRFPRSVHASLRIDF